MPPGTAAALRTIAIAAGLALTLGGCGQVTVGEQPHAGSATAPGSATATGPGSGAGTGPEAEAETATATATGTAASPELTPGPDATPGCEELVEPVHRLITGAGDTGSNSAEVRRLADGVEDNALSAVASRLSGLVTQDEVDPVVVDGQWDQFRQLCDLP